jgi:hypothetical protein
VDRVLSEFRYVRRFRKRLVRFAETPAQFLDHFLSADKQTSLRFDNHNKGLLDYLTNSDGSLESSIYIDSLDRVDEWLKELSLPAISVSERRNVTLADPETERECSFSSEEIERIRDYYKKDVQWYEARFG